MASIDREYHNILRTIFKDGRIQPDPNRKGTNRLNITKYDFKYDLRKGFPAISTKKIYWKGVTEELLWFLNGGTNIIPLVRRGVNFWNKDAYNHYARLSREAGYPVVSFDDFEVFLSRDVPPIMDIPNYVFGDVGPIYGSQWRNFQGSTVYKNMDQVEVLLRNMINRPLASDLIVTAWNPTQRNEMALAPCHFGFQIMMYELDEKDLIVANGLNEKDYNKTPADGSNNVAEIKYGFDLVWSQRSTDAFLGLPINIASYALLAHIIGRLTNTLPGNLIGDLRNVHLYDNQIDAAKKQLYRNVYKHKNSFLIDHHTTEYKEIMEDYFNGGRLSFEKLDTSKYIQGNYESYPNISVEMLAYNN